MPLAPTTKGFYTVIDELRDQIKQRLDELASEAERLRTALGALDGGTPSASSDRRSPGGRRARSAVRGREARAARPARARRTPSGSSRRGASGSTKTAVLDALADGGAMTASQVAARAGLGRGTVSTTLSKLAKSGEVEKAARGYQLPAHAGATAAAA
jgi:DNA-binding transcriptional ArsR family regulator